MKVIASVLVAILLTACPGTNTTTDTTTDTTMKMTAGSPSLEGTSWVLSSLPGRPPAGGQPATLQFQGGRASGSDGCNRYTGAYSVKGASIELPVRAAATLMACPENLQKQAEAFMRALGMTKSYRLTERWLELLDADGAITATFVAQSQALAGTKWRVTGINNGKNAVASVVADTNVTLVFSADGQASGSAGCNAFNARYEITDGGLKVLAPIATTRKMCRAPGVMEQEQSFLKALEAASVSRIEGGRLELRDANDKLMITATADAGG